MGSIYSYTVQRYPPPLPNECPMPWRPRPISWVDLDNEGPRVLAPVECDPDSLAIQMRVRLVCEVQWKDEQGREVVAYKFVPHLALDGAQ